MIRGADLSSLDTVRYAVLRYCSVLSLLTPWCAFINEGACLVFVGKKIMGLNLGVDRAALGKLQPSDKDQINCNRMIRRGLVIFLPL